MGKPQNLKGQRFGRLVAGRRFKKTLGKTPRSYVFYECKCDCGLTTEVKSEYLTNGDTRSCGCFQEQSKRAPKSHGATCAGNDGVRRLAPSYISWSGMKQRCHDPEHKDYAEYGGRGIKICERWLGRDGYPNFLADMGERTKDLSLERIDSNGMYEPSNCKWASNTEQIANRRNTLELVEYEGIVQSINEWADAFGLTYYVLYTRLKNGWAIQKALETPVLDSWSKKKPSPTPLGDLFPEDEEPNAPSPNPDTQIW